MEIRTLSAQHAELFRAMVPLYHTPARRFQFQVTDKSSHLAQSRDPETAGTLFPRFFNQRSHSTRVSIEGKLNIFPVFRMETHTDESINTMPLWNFFDVIRERLFDLYITRVNIVSVGPAKFKTVVSRRRKHIQKNTYSV